MKKTCTYLTKFTINYFKSITQKLQLNFKIIIMTTGNEFFNILTFKSTNQDQLNKFDQRLRSAIDFSQNLVNLTILRQGDQSDLNIRLKPELLIIEPIIIDEQDQLITKNDQTITLQIWTQNTPFNDHALKALVQLNQLDGAICAYYEKSNYHYGLIKTDGKQILMQSDHFPNDLDLTTFHQAIKQLDDQLKFSSKPKWKFWKR